MVAPATVSTAMLPDSDMSAGISSMALEPTPSVSPAPSAVTAVIAPSVKVTVTVTSPPKPLAVPVKSPLTSAGAASPSAAPVITNIMAVRIARMRFFMMVLPPW